ncbi:carbohydrate ABC transporter permease [Dactylosporangium sp. AC04546]|uniref:carbohydrate ABC transporter permease n=1 Tax=Dactylosporangium sp. AC04546 TaxID=2862460 RepID=UPI001EE14BE7|nr:carbohydrate ABC transporter permease [Dactylosporangium sp. AC04546]WVK85185.1 carbohydrate ABC transporter permease [Dactylosporangium sp. AC04546]
MRRALRYGILIFFAVIFIYPFVLSFATSFKSRPEVASSPVIPWPQAFDTRAWTDVLVHSDFPLWTFNSILVTVLATLGRVFLDSLAGYSLARLTWRGRNLVFAGVVSVLAVPPIVLTVPRFLVLKEMSLLNSYTGLILPLAVDAMGIFLMRQFFAELPRELEEAARIDGASIFQAYWHVVLPLARPALLTLTILSFQGVWNEFLMPLIVVRASPEHWTLPFGLSTLGRGGAGGQSYDYPVMMAGSILTIIPVAIVFIIFQRFFVRGVAQTGVKG